MAQGTIKKKKQDRGFGFINSENGDLFFHVSAMTEDGLFDQLTEGQVVEYERGEGRNGKPCATSVSVVE